MTIACLTPIEVKEAQPLLIHYLGHLARENLPRVYAAALVNHAQVWFIMDGPDLQAVYVTAIKDRDGFRVLELLYLAGRCGLKGLIEMHEALDAMKEHNNCDWMEVRTDRKAARALRRFGWEPVHDCWWRF